MPRRKVISNDLGEIVAAYEAVSKPSEVHQKIFKTIASMMSHHIHPEVRL